MIEVPDLMKPMCERVEQDGSAVLFAYLGTGWSAFSPHRGVIVFEKAGRKFINHGGMYVDKSGRLAWTIMTSDEIDDTTFEQVKANYSALESKDEK